MNRIWGIEGWGIGLGVKNVYAPVGIGLGVSIYKFLPTVGIGLGGYILYIKENIYKYKYIKKRPYLFSLLPLKRCL